MDLTINFYRRNYIEGLFLSSGVFKDPDTTMERLVRVAKKLREEEHFNGYIHLKTIPGASELLVHQAGLYADRLSINLEIPTKEGLKLLAPEKDHKQMIAPMQQVKNELAITSLEQKKFKHTPPKQVLIRGFIAEVNVTNLDRAGIDWSIVGGQIS